MAKQIIIAEQHHIAAVFSEDQIEELIVTSGNQQVSDIYLGIVENVIPGIDAAFVNIGDAERNGFIHVTDLGPLRLKKTAGAITELLAPQQKVLVQVMKEPTGNKGPRLTGNITLPGRYLVLMPHGKGVNLSRRIKNENERSRLRALAILVKPAGMGLLVRTEAEGKPEEAIMEDLENLLSQWESIEQQSNQNKPPALLNRDDDFIQKVLREAYTNEVNRIVADSPAGLKRVKQQLSNWSNGRPPEGVFIDHYQNTQSILDYFRINAAIKEALKPRVDLPSGGYIIIEPTEALTVIDVNSGSFTRSATSRETVLWTNNEAATEIARQLRLRNIGGVIIVDFIDMDTKQDQLKLLEHFNKTLRADKARPQIAQLSELGLVELTRKRQGKNIYELFGQTCSHCGGLGYLAHVPGLKEAQGLETANTNAPPPVAPVLKTTETLVLPDVETKVIQELTEEPELLTNGEELEQNGASNQIRRRRRRRPEEDDLADTPATITSEKDQDYTPVPKKEKDRTISLRSSRREEPKVEKISVEMTPLEQEIYALMGISPLLRLDRQIDNNQSVIISVKVPEETTETTETPLTSEISTTESITETWESSPETDMEATELETNSTIIRRKRRRSSALENQA
ncbi:MAG: Rne/Rng family ribonuclease [Gloeocapsa sp. DLM2.Bin57]|nr:MAG: Rne/Rng family ribonuclease [Gloeocapsa sp. DLM2.Bin57]